MRTKAQRSKAGHKNGNGDPVLTKKQIRQRKWEIRQLIQQHGGRCVYCTDQVNLVHDDPKQATRDHIVPTSKGGSELMSNLQLACRTCNLEKDDRTPEEYLAYRAEHYPAD